MSVWALLWLDVSIVQLSAFFWRQQQAPGLIFRFMHIYAYLPSVSILSRSLSPRRCEIIWQHFYFDCLNSGAKYCFISQWTKRKLKCFRNNSPCCFASWTLKIINTFDISPIHLQWKSASHYEAFRLVDYFDEWGSEIENKNQWWDRQEESCFGIIVKINICRGLTHNNVDYSDDDIDL